MLCSEGRLIMTKEELRKIVGKNIRRERLSRFMTIEKLAEMLDLSPGFVGLIEHGNRGATTYNLYKLSELFGVGVETFYAVDEGSKIVRLSEDTALNSKRDHLISLTQDLTDTEIDFITHTLKMVYKLRLPD